MPDMSTASAAPTLDRTSTASHKPPQRQQQSASLVAAGLAKGYQMPAPWEPTHSSDGAKAALLASRTTKNPDPWKPPATSYGHSAANLAFKSDRNALLSPRSNTPERQKSLRAAKGAMAGRQRAQSSPLALESYPGEAKAASNALAAASRAHQPTRSVVRSEEAGAVPFTTMNREMFTSRPPVKPEVDEQKKADVLHASALAMAKKMYGQQKMIDAKKHHVEAASPGGRRDSLGSLSDDGQPARFTTLQEAAYRQAQERLAKIHQENLKNRDYQEYYGAGQPQRRFAVLNKLRRRASSDSAVVDDQARSQQIRRQMSIFSNKLSEVDGKKRQQDRDALLAVAQRNVRARLKSMDEKITAETGMVPHSTLTEWELKAHAAAQTRSEARLDSNADTVDVGAGLRVDRETIDAIAARRVQPVLDEINEKAEKEQARQIELKLEMERKKEEEEREKARQKEILDINRRLKEQDKQLQKQRKAEEKQEAKAKKEEEKAAKAELKRLTKSEKHHPSPDEPQGHEEQPQAIGETVVTESSNQPVSIPRPASPTAASPNRQDEEADEAPKTPRDEENPNNKGFVGGAALTGMERNNNSSTSLDGRSGSIRAIAMAGRDQSRERTPVRDGSSAPATAGNEADVSPMSDSGDGEHFTEAPEPPLSALTPPPKTIPDNSTKGESPGRDSRFREIM
ncbi:hypothetical protein DL766_007654 [Monosporascus sp. MC13-8B]|nr:hypothetical protein DL763_007478 [Monosporascus cannonballus]RYP22730.1 hypothetical protein DL766_007654 [Monosporascus sp. MC13-8B]